MKSHVFAAVLALGSLGTFASSARAEEKPKPLVAILPFQSPNDHNLALMGRNAQPTFTTELVKSKKVRVVSEVP